MNDTINNETATPPPAATATVATQPVVATVTKPTTTTISTPLPHSVNQQQIQQDLTAMIRYASKRGIVFPPGITLNNPTDDTQLIANYNTMVTAIKPATAQSINYINRHVLGDGEEKKWYATPIISKCLLLAGIALISLILMSLSPDVNSANQKAGLLNADGKVLFYNLLFVCSASLLGVMFYLLKTTSDKIKEYTLLPVDAIEVNATIIIGVISGFIIAELFDFNEAVMAGSVEAQKMTLALLGGFSSDAIFSVLKGVVNKTKALFAPPGNN
ncbi:MAG: hypothetical protein AAF960_07785 [Bacteroidota bacterium]